MISISMDEFIDWESGTADFDNEKFIRILEMVDMFPSETDIKFGEYDMIAKGRQIMSMSLFMPNYFTTQRTLFNGELVFKGYPNENRDGNAFTPETQVAITSNCKDADAAWEFVRLFLLEDYQINSPGPFPATNAAFEKRLDELMNLDVFFDYFTMSDGYSTVKITDQRITQAEADTIRDLVANTTRITQKYNPLRDIIDETAGYFFKGWITAQDAARVIQNRTSRYLSEQAR